MGGVFKGVTILFYIKTAGVSAMMLGRHGKLQARSECKPATVVKRLAGER